MARTRKGRPLTGQRDGIRLIGWCCVALAPLVLAAPAVDLQPGREALLRLCQNGVALACLPRDVKWPEPWHVALPLFGFGVLLLAIRRPIRSEEKIECPFCAEPIRVEAVVCPHCRSEFDRRKDLSNRGRQS
jgi:hypothetical protein